MGQRQSEPTEVKEERSRYAVLYRRLYRELSAPDDTGAPADDQVFRVSSLT